MTLFTEHPYSRVMVFIDYRNLADSVTEPELTRLDVFRLTQVLVSGRDLVAAYIFDATFKHPSKDDPNVRLHDSLAKQGFRVMSRNTLVRTDSGDGYVQKEVDVAMSVEMVKHALMNHYDTAIVVSGDRDFIPAIEAIQSFGKRVEVASFSASISEECKKASDVYYTLDDLPFLSLSELSEEDDDE